MDNVIESISNYITQSGKYTVDDCQGSLIISGDHNKGPLHYCASIIILYIGDGIITICNCVGATSTIELSHHDCLDQLMRLIDHAHSIVEETCYDDIEHYE